MRRKIQSWPTNPCCAPCTAACICLWQVGNTFVYFCRFAGRQKATQAKPLTVVPRNAFHFGFGHRIGQKELGIRAKGASISQNPSAGTLLGFWHALLQMHSGTKGCVSATQLYRKCSARQPDNTPKKDKYCNNNYKDSPGLQEEIQFLLETGISKSAGVLVLTLFQLSLALRLLLFKFN